MAKHTIRKNTTKGVKIGIVASRFNDFITKRLLEACLQELSKRGVSPKDITLAWVPGSYEIPVVALKFAMKKNIQAVIGLGAVIRGETLHFDLVSQAAAQGLTQVSLVTGKPAIFGVLTTDTVDQAYKRSDPKKDNKGRDAADAALEMIDVLKEI